MRDQNNLADQLIELTENSIRDLYRITCSVDKNRWETSCLEEDIRYVRKRFQNEGLSFLTVVMPSLGKALDSAIQHQDWCANWRTPRGLTNRSDGVYNVAVLRYPLEEIFQKWIHLDSQRTRVREVQELVLSADVVDPELHQELEYSMYKILDCERTLAKWIRVFRTVCYLFYKLEEEPSDEQKSAAKQNFLSNERALWTKVQLGTHTQRLLATAQVLLDQLLDDLNVEKLLQESLFHPKHGPGAVATGEKGDEKWTMRRYSRSLNRVLPWYETIGGLRSTDRSHFHRQLILMNKSMEWVDKWISKVHLVPKDSRGPRLICAEPLELQWLQQALATVLVKRIESSELTKGHVNFTDQGVNRTLALENSKGLGGRYATIDMKDASDLVSLDLVQMLFPKGLFALLEVLRSSAVQFPDGETIDIRKFAPMGSALCFPVESLVFWSICTAALHVNGVPVDRAIEDVYVYGDDIVVPSCSVDVVRGALEAFGLKVNLDKSCYQGSFRESCGMDALFGECITPVKIKKRPGSRISEGPAHYAWCNYSDQLNSLDMHMASAFVAKAVTSVLGVIPITTEPRGYLSFVRCNAWALPMGCKMRYNTELQTLEIYTWRLTLKSDASVLEDTPRLLRGLTSPVREGDPDRVVARGATQMKKRWIEF